MRRRTLVRGDFLWAFTFWRGIASKFAIYEGNVLGLVGSKQYFWMHVAYTLYVQEGGRLKELAEGQGTLTPGGSRSPPPSTGAMPPSAADGARASCRRWLRAGLDGPLQVSLLTRTPVLKFIGSM